MTWNVKLELAGKLFSKIPVPCSNPKVTLAGTGQVAAPLAAVQATAVQIKPATGGSLTTVLVAAEGPPLLATMSYTTVCPAVKELTLFVLVMFKFAHGKMGVPTLAELDLKT